jgi:phosphoglycerol transferase
MTAYAVASRALENTWRGVACFLNERPHYLLPIATVAFFVFLAVAYLGTYPHIMADEQYYSVLSRLAPLSAAEHPNYLYYLIFRATNFCGEEFLACARIFNITALIAAAPFIYLVAREVCGRPAAVLIAAIAILGPYNSYAAYFMPESLFFLSFWLFAWCLLTMPLPGSLERWGLCGAAFGAAVLVKPHALLLAPAVVMTSLLVALGSGSSLRSALARILALAAGATVVKFGLSYALAGRSGLTLFGGYTSAAIPAGFDYERFRTVFLLTLDSLRGHSMGLCILFGLPIVVAISNLLDRPQAPTRLQSRRLEVSIFVLLAIISLAVIVATFAASWFKPGAWINEIIRVHMRYYNYLFPLFLILAAERMNRADSAPSSLFRFGIAIPVVLIIVYAMAKNLDGFMPSFIDSPELSGIVRYRGVFLFVGTLSILAIVLWTWSSAVGARAFCLVVAPLCAAISWYVVLHDLRPRIAPEVYDRAGLFVRSYLSSEDRDRIVVIGSNAPGLYRALFHIDSLNGSVLHVEDKPDEPLPALSPDRRWALTFKETRFAADPPLILRLSGFNLVQLPDSGKR